jgi:nucleotide-binding universal stress UspA family protein
LPRGESALGNDALAAEAVHDLEDIARIAGVGALGGAIAVVDPGVGHAICKVANALPRALVVVGAHQIGRLRSLVAVAPHVIRHCARPVLVVRVPEPTQS